MLNLQNQRELAYVVAIDAIEPIVGSDNCEAAVVGGWKVMVHKGTFQPNDLAIYFEIDSQVPATPQFEFLAAKHYKVKTQKYTFGGKNPGFYSQGLLMAPSDFGWGAYTDGDGTQYIHDHEKNISYGVGDFLTKELGVTYADPMDNIRKAESKVDKYQQMAKRMSRKFSKQPYRWLMKRSWGQKLLFLLFGRKKDKRSWPAWVIKTDEERVQNCPDFLTALPEWFATEKVDGTSTTATMRGYGRKREFYICSRNVCFDTPEKMAKGAYYDTNVYQEMALKYDFENVLADILDKDKKNLEFVTLQGETYGEGIQKRTYNLKGRDFAAFNLIFGYKDGTRKRLNPREMADFLTPYSIPCVPIVDAHFKMPATVDELLRIATGESKIDGGMREGLVFRAPDGTMSFKAVSNEFLIKYHQ